ncbi:MAG: AIR synthase-related protein [Candidatus Hodarchaeota archaeon]
MKVLPLGKVPWSILTDLVCKTGFINRGIIQNAEQGVDVAVLDLQEVIEHVNKIYQTHSIPFFVYKADPITFPTPNPSKYLIIINRNDLATAGAIPYGITATILLPHSTTKNRLIEIQNNLSQVCEEHKITILGGHTEVTENVQYPILSGNMIGFVPPEYYIPRNPQVGDHIICSGWVGAEGTGILLAEAENYFSKSLNKHEYLQGIQIGKEIDIFTRTIECNLKFHDSLTLVHDCTEGGIFGALYECLAPKNLGCNVTMSKIPLSPVTKKVTEMLKLNPYKLISSGAVLLVCDNTMSQIIRDFLRSFDLPAEIIGEVTEKGNPIHVNNVKVGPPESDHIILGLDNLKKSKNRLH